MTRSDSGRLLGRVFPSNTQPQKKHIFDDGSRLSDDEIQKANKELFKDITSLSDERMQWAKDMHQHLVRSFRSLKAMCIIAFGVGLFLLVVPFIAFYLSESHDSELLIFSGIGLAETLALLIYKPIERIQNATSDMMQSTMLLSSWAAKLATILYLLNLGDIKTRQDIEANVNLISGCTREHVAWLQRHTET